ncbi:---NA--- [Podarcis lilfordi]|uniref:---NA n=1 Tax=Podarcis lilfordi TaxID=74358 RepID=A0AA35P0X1_9SAUR|nr:---NA--- [Podarcis lilfordi]
MDLQSTRNLRMLCNAIVPRVLATLYVVPIIIKGLESVFIIISVAKGSAQDDEPQNPRQCFKTNGICFPLGCPNNSKKIGRCIHNYSCCQRREE